MSELSISLSLLLLKQRDIVLYRLNSLQAGSLKKVKHFKLHLHARIAHMPCGI